MGKRRIDEPQQPFGQWDLARVAIVCTLFMVLGKFTADVAIVYCRTRPAVMTVVAPTTVPAEVSVIVRESHSGEWDRPDPNVADHSLADRPIHSNMDWQRLPAHSNMDWRDIHRPSIGQSDY